MEEDEDDEKEDEEEEEEVSPIWKIFLNGINPINVQEWPDMRLYAKFYEIFKVSTSYSILKKLRK